MNNYEKRPIPRKQLILISLVLIGAFAFQIISSRNSLANQGHFDSARALDDVAFQLSFGPRIPGQPGHMKLVTWVVNALPEYGWQVKTQKGKLGNQTVENIIAHKGVGSRWIILGAHYDSRQFADQDPDQSKHSQPVPGANDGGSGVAMLMELARVLPIPPDTEVWLVFFDSEDQGNIEENDWIMGSRFFVENLEGQPDAVVILDMIGDPDLNIYQEKNSDKALTAKIWQAAQSLGYEKYFIPEEKHSMLDDHTPFLQKGIPAVDLIDFDDPEWHTTGDDMNNVSAESLQIVGDTIIAWLAEKE